MILTIKATRKLWTVMLVSRRLWAEVSAWRTAVSALKGWKLEVTPHGVRVITPIVSGAICLDWGNR